MGGKIFCIGLNKTGTTSLAEALRVLGYEVVHFGDRDLSPLIDRACRKGKPLFTYVPSRYGRADAYADVAALTRNFDVADREFPGSRFILSTRELGPWLDSRERHVRRNQEAAAKNLYSGGFLTVNREEWTRQWYAHHERVTQYFAGRPNDILVWKVEDGWDPLTSFLDLPLPCQPFPWANLDGQSQGFPRTTRLRRSARRGRIALRIVTRGRIPKVH